MFTHNLSSRSFARPGLGLLLFVLGTASQAQTAGNSQLDRSPTREPAPRVFVQSDWSGGSPQGGAVSNWSSGFSSGDLSGLGIPGQLVLPSEIISTPRRETITTQSRGTKGLGQIDIDRDGVQDLIACRPTTDPFQRLGEIYWWKRLGPGHWTRHVVTAEFYGGYDIKGADVDGDGDNDIVVCAFYGTPTNNGRFAWFENVDGFGMVWSQHLVASNFYGASNVEVVDLDLDGDVDIVGSASLAYIGNANDDVAWFENVNGDGTRWSQHRIDNGYLNALAVEITDLDGDGDLDVVGTSYGANDEIAWWENLDGFGYLGPRQALETSFSQISFLDTADIDQNGIVDLVGGAPVLNSLAFWENTTAGMSEFPVVPVGLPGQLIWNAVDTGDLDGDGDIDIVGAASSGSQNYFLWWWENDGTLNTGAWPLHMLDTFASGYGPVVHVADFNNDGRVEIVAAAQNTDVNQLFTWKVSRFQPTGQLISSILDGGPSVTWGRVEWNADVRARTSLLVEVRTGTTPGGLGAFQTVESSGTSLAGLVDTKARYFQYRLSMKTTNSRYSTILREFRVTAN